MLAYFEMIGGASGNMLLGALVDAGADVAELERALRTIPVEKPWTLRCERVVKRGIAATHVEILVPGEDGSPDHVHRMHGPGVSLAQVLETVRRSGLTPAQKARASAIYERLAAAEARVHGAEPGTVHFHEIGETDAILDVAGACVLLDALGVETVACSAFPIGRASVRMHHGTYPNPPPATADLLRGFATYDGGIPQEMVTTTGAAVLTTLATPRDVRPAMRAERIGYGTGSSDFSIPNVLRVSIGPEATVAGAPAEHVAVLEANIDDMSPQYFELALERAFGAGALDAWLTPITMKKGRPAVLFSVIAPLELEGPCAQAVLAHTTTLGVRVRHERRVVLERTVEAIATPFGPIRVKTALIGDRHRRTLEYDDLARAAREHGLPLAEVALAVGKIVDAS